MELSRRVGKFIVGHSPIKNRRAILTFGTEAVLGAAGAAGAFLLVEKPILALAPLGLLFVGLIQLWRNRL